MRARSSKKQCHDAQRALVRIIGGGSNARQEKFQPGLPRAALTHLLQQPVIVGPVRLQIQAQVQQRFPQHLLFGQEQRD